MGDGEIVTSVVADDAENTEEPQTPWSDRRGTDLLTQLQGAANVVVAAEEGYRDKAACFAIAGQDVFHRQTRDVTLDIQERALIFRALELLGHFSPDLEKAIFDLGERIRTVNVEVLEARSDEDVEAMTDAGIEVEVTQLADYFGLTPDQFDVKAEIEKAKATVEAMKAEHGEDVNPSDVL